MKVFVVAPHMDDEVLGAGATIARRVSEGDEVHVCVVAHRVYGHVFDAARNRREVECARRAREVLGYEALHLLDLPDERLDACLQDVIVPLERCLEKVAPDVVYVNHRGDNHQDHRAVFQATMVVVRPAATRLLGLFAYETPSSTDQSPPTPEAAFLPTLYVNVEQYLDRKLEALRCYEAERRAFPHPRSEEAVAVLARRRGVEAGFAAAEAFVALRERRP